MVPGDVIGLAVLDDASPASVGGAGPAMVLNLEFEEALARPAQHIGFHLVEGVASRSDPQAAERVPTRAAVDLGAAADVKSGMRFDGFPAVLEVIEIAAADAQPRMRREPLPHGFEVIGLAGK